MKVYKFSVLTGPRRTLIVVQVAMFQMGEHGVMAPQVLERCEQYEGIYHALQSW
jgi:hypothetical protein